jgi:hypothetical protein
VNATAVRRLLAAGDVGWAGTDLGLIPQMSDDDERLASELDDSDIPALLDALDRQETFVKAHVLMTRLTGVEHETFPTWNGLAVDIRADGSAHIDPSQRPVMAERWRRWQSQREPHRALAWDFVSS